MPKTRYGTRYWLDRYPASRRPSYPQHRGDLRTEVAIVGGGAIGCVTAYVFAAAGVKVALIEASRLAQAQAAGGSGIVLHEPETDFHKLVKLHGVRDSRLIYTTSRRGSLEYLAAIRRLRIDCGLKIRDAVHVSSVSDDTERLENELDARRNAGIPVTSLKGAALFKRFGFNGLGLVTHGNASVDPYRASIGFAKAAAARGAMVFERSAVKRIRAKRREVEISTAKGTITASKVVVATGWPTDDFKPLRRRFSHCMTYMVLTPELPAAVRREMPPPDMILRDTASPDHWMQWLGDRVLFAGADQASIAERAREKAIVQRTGQLMYELSVMRPAISGAMPDYAWDLEYARTIDGIPYFGPHRNYPHHLFAFGGGPGGLGLTFAAARMLLRSYLGTSEKGDEPFLFTRIRE